MFALNVNKTCARIPVIHTPPVSSFFCIYMLQCGNEVVNGEQRVAESFTDSDQTAISGSVVQCWSGRNMQ